MVLCKHTAGRDEASVKTLRVNQTGRCIIAPDAYLGSTCTFKHTFDYVPLETKIQIAIVPSNSNHARYGCRTTVVCCEPFRRFLRLTHPALVRTRRLVMLQHRHDCRLRFLGVREVHPSGQAQQDASTDPHVKSWSGPFLLRRAPLRPPPTALRSVRGIFSSPGGR